jgi:SAM-dependent methyltransferase
MNKYYDMAAKASKEIGNHPGLKKLKQLVSESNKVLDVGCGEGSRLETMMPKGRSGWGVDISETAIKYAQNNYSHHTFNISDASRLPFDSNFFDLIYSAFTIEHVTKPKLVINEMLRVCKSRGKFVVLCPNYGAPNRRSPVSLQNPFIKLLKGLAFDFFPDSLLHWDKVVPEKNYTAPDTDTAVEPYLHSFIYYLKSLPVKIINYSSVWEEEAKSNNPRKLIVKILGKMGLFPFKYWGPQVFVVAQKI